MNTLEKEKLIETNCLNKILMFIKGEISKEEDSLQEYFSRLLTTRREMWENSAHASKDFDKIPEMVQYLAEVNHKNRNYNETAKKIEKYNRLLDSPYFGRFDFEEEGESLKEEIYIGISNLIDPETFKIHVYDWRAPVSSIYYQYQLGEVLYNSPEGTIKGMVLLKRQYKIRKSALAYFFDSDIRIGDEILQEVLGHNSSSKMRNIVQTIQKEQDKVIRDSENELLIVQGVAGSGKTSIALHRIAYLLYQGMNTKLNSNNIIIISPSLLFSNYISDVLPELGEENVCQTTFDELFLNTLGGSCKIKTRADFLETIISQGPCGRINETIFKGSRDFKLILDRLVRCFENKLLAFEDIYYDGKIIFTKQQLKSMFLNNKINMPVTKRLKRMERIIFNVIEPLRKPRLEKIEKIVKNSEGHEFEIKSFSRLLAIRETKRLTKVIHSFTNVDFREVYKILFNKKGLFERLSEGIKVSEDLRLTLAESLGSLTDRCISYEDCGPLMYLKLKLEGSQEFSDIRQVFIDEAQDYYPIQYEIYRLLFESASFTILGDVNQCVERDADNSIYDEISFILNKRKYAKLFLNKGYRSSYEINLLAKKILKPSVDIFSFERHEEVPVISFKNSLEEIDMSIREDVEHFHSEGYESVAIICKSGDEAAKTYDRLKPLIDIKLLLKNDDEYKKGILVVPSYISKGLEFDVAIIYDASDLKYHSDIDRKLLYIACTRALHRLVIYYSGEKSSFI